MEFERPDLEPIQQTLGKANKDKKKAEKKGKKKSRDLKLPLTKDVQKTLGEPKEKSLGETWREIAGHKKDEEGNHAPADKSDDKLKPESKADEEQTEDQPREPEKTAEEEPEHNLDELTDVITVELDEIDVEWEIPLHPEAEDASAQLHKPAEQPASRPKRPKEAVAQGPASESLAEEVMAPAAEPLADSESEPQDYLRSSGALEAETVGRFEPNQVPSEPLVEAPGSLPQPIWSQQAEIMNQSTAVNPNLSPQAGVLTTTEKQDIKRLKRRSRRQHRGQRKLSEQHKQLRAEVSAQNKKLSKTNQEQSRTAGELQKLKNTNRESHPQSLSNEHSNNSNNYERLWREVAPKPALVEVAQPPALVEHPRQSPPLEELPPEAQEIAERLRIPPEHQLVHSSWHTIEVDKKTGRPVEEPTLAYGQEFEREQSQEALQPEPVEAAIAAAGGHSLPSQVAGIGMLPIPGTATLPAAPPPQPPPTPAPLSETTVIRERRQVVSNFGDLVLIFFLIVIIIAIIIAASA